MPPRMGSFLLDRKLARDRLDAFDAVRDFQETISGVLVGHDTEKRHVTVEHVGIDLEDTRLFVFDDPGSDGVRDRRIIDHRTGCPAGMSRGKDRHARLFF